jgi:hypothetical protein
MSGYKFPVILFFIEGMNPTNNEAAEALKIGPVTFRNASAINANEKLERCDGVAGDPDVIPEGYEGKVPVITDLEGAMKLMAEKQEAINAAAMAHLSPTGKKGSKKSAASKEAGNETAPAALWKANA